MATVNVRFNRPQSLAHMAIERAIQARLQPGAPDTITTVTLPWGRGVGKSKFTRLLWWSLIAKWDGKERPTSNGGTRRGIRIVHLMPTHKQCVDVHGKDTLEELYHDDWAVLGGVVNKTRWEIKFPGGSWIQWFGTTDANNNRGLRCDVVTEDEVDDIEPGVDQAIVLPYLSEPWSLKLKLATGTPRRGRTGLLWIGHNAALEGKPGFYSFHATYKDAPQQVSAEYVESVRAITDPIVFQREWECNFDSAEGMVYSMFDREFHVREPNPRQRWTEILVGIDHGYEDPGVMLVIGVIGNGRDAECWILDEVHKQHETPSWWIKRAKLLAEQWNMDIPDRRGSARDPIPCRWFADPSRPDMIQEYVRAGIRVEPAKNSIEDGVLAVADRLIPRLAPNDPDGKRRYAKLYIHPRCKETIAEVGKYRRRRDPRNPDRILEAIEDKHNHCFVAGTMVMTDRGEIPIEDIRAGMRVLTREGYFPVKAAGMTNEAASVWALTMIDGRRLTGTPGHLIWSAQNGWTRLDALRPGDILFGWRQQNPLFFSASHTADIQSQRDVPIASTSNQAAARRCIGPFTSTITDQSRPSTTSTTQTATRPTTLSRICNVSPVDGTSLSTCSARTVANGLVKIFEGPSLPLQSGIAAKRGGSGIGSTEESSGRSASQSSKYASSAEANSTVLRVGRATDFAVTIANQRGAEPQRSTMLTEHAPTAEQCFESTNTGGPRVAQSDAVVRSVVANHVAAAVYDLTVDGPPEFFANGILVHNCLDAGRYALFTRFGGPSRERHESGPGWGVPQSANP